MAEADDLVHRPWPDQNLEPILSGSTNQPSWNPDGVLGGIADLNPPYNSLDMLMTPEEQATIAPVDAGDPPPTITDGPGLIAQGHPATLDQGDPVLPVAPPGVDVNKNIQRAEKTIPDPGLSTRPQAYGLMFQLFPDGHEMDYKTQGDQYRDFGNFNYGAFGSALGLSPYELHTGAGIQQMRSGTWSPSYGLPGLFPPAGDNPRDYEMIDEGIQYYQTHKGK
ncbi:MAG TPA: polymorphic toxin type 44 domain-containing protein [Rhizomicrobium sp.]|nr:polymorphic toxin type 44 domain-containing protein [Rhizomicrobium sp.]